MNRIRAQPAGGATMRATRFHAPGAPLRLEEVPVPQPGPGDALVEVRAAGICGTDLHILHGDIPPARTPITLGHEVAGVVAGVGADVAEWQRGDRVCVYPHTPCGTCEVCRGGRESICPNTQILGLHLDGGFAGYMRVPATCLVHLPEVIPFAAGAVITDAVSTAYHALTRRGAMREGEAVAVFGCGGVGHHVIMLARLLGAGRIAAVDVAAGALRRAQEAGADVLIEAAAEQPSKAVRAATGGAGVDIALECVGRAAVVGEALRSLKRGGRLVLVGVGPERAELPPLRTFVGAEITVLGSMGFDRAELSQVIELASGGRLDLARSVAEVPLDAIGEAFERLERREGDLVRLVVVP